MGKAFNLLDN